MWKTRRMTCSPRVRVFAICGLLLALAVAAVDNHALRLSLAEQCELAAAYRGAAIRLGVDALNCRAQVTGPQICM